MFQTGFWLSHQLWVTCRQTDLLTHIHQFQMLRPEMMSSADDWPVLIQVCIRKPKRSVLQQAIKFWKHYFSKAFEWDLNNKCVFWWDLIWQLLWGIPLLSPYLKKHVCVSFVHPCLVQCKINNSKNKNKVLCYTYALSLYKNVYVYKCYFTLFT